MLGGERGGDAGVSEFDLIITEEAPLPALLLHPLCPLLVELHCGLHLFGDGHVDVFADVIELPFKFELLFLLLILFFDDLADVGSAYYCYS